ncbi:GGDEF domain-containing phosphodiesterase [Labrenzia sp. PHM005]|uniref:GGDEF domain-containing phosphodiesterase n=1 Tax=Labrenzia sp. PHM005 TaxID=2590016 RepID=UPI001140636D|nr:GGDEF domain-containing phosphodiesterase [Labrenzia sp. PHM005]QDG77637.1 EAL domain-containing protein [Labrenzia sp. PHM005]
MHRSDLRRYVLPAVFFALSLALAVNTVLLFEQRQDTQTKDQALHEIIEASARLDTVRLENQLMTLLKQPGAEKQASVKRALAVFLNELDTWQINPVLSLEPETDFIKSRLAEAKIRARKTQKLIADLDEHRSVEHALETVNHIGVMVNQVRQMTSNRIAAVWQKSANDLKFRQNIQSSIIAALLATALLWIVSLYRRIYSLGTEKMQAGTKTVEADAQLRRDPVTGLMTQSELIGKVRELKSELTDKQEIQIVNLAIIVPWTGGGSENVTVRDSILATVADRIQNLVSLNLKSGYCARATGNSFFVALVHEIGSEAAPSEFVHRLRRLIHQPVVVKTGTYPVTSIAGIAPVDLEERDPGVSFQNAELTVAEEIQTGRRHVGVYTPALRASSERRLGIEQALLQALDQEDCLPHFQPQFDLTTGKIVGVEALARWYHPDLGWIAPAEIIPIAENNGLIISLERKILETACAQVQLLPGEPDLAVNLSVAHLLNDDVPAMVEDCLAASGFPASRLKLEIPAGNLPAAFDLVRDVLDALRKLDVKLSLDNFGTPSATLSGVLQYQWDEVKIDTALTGISGDGQVGHELMSMALTSVRALGSRPLIEGIETIDQRDMLTSLGCQTGQGYLFGGPMAIDDLKALFFSDKPNIAQLMI